MIEPSNITIGSLFSGIGGFELGLQWAGFGEIKWQVEVDEFCNKVLEKRFPHTKKYKDIKDVGKKNLESVGLICGGFPCQPFSVAGKRKGKEDDCYLWQEMLRVIAEIKPSFVIGENVPGIINMVLDEVLFDLESENYKTTTFIIPACAVNAPHRRDRVWILGYSEHNGQYSSKDRQSRDSDVAYTDAEHSKEYQRGNQFRYEGSKEALGRSIYEPMWKENWLEVATCLCRVDDGIPNRVDRLKCLGNAVVPQVAQAIGEILIKYIIK